MNKKDLIHFLKAEIEPLDDPTYGPGYRAAVYLKDGTYLPAVVFRNPEMKLDLAIRRFKQQAGKGILEQDEHAYRELVKLFVTTGNSVNNYDIRHVEKSPFAFPAAVLDTIESETTMGWTGFVAKMKDGKLFGFGTSFQFEFFQLPAGYTSDDIEEIINHSYISTSGELKSHSAAFSRFPDDYDDAAMYRERPCFECFIDGL